MKYKLDDGWIKLIKSASKTIDVGYDSDIDDEGYIEVEDLLRLIEELNYELEHVKEEYEELENDLIENYKPRYDDYEFNGVSPRDFF